MAIIKIKPCGTKSTESIMKNLLHVKKLLNRTLITWFCVFIVILGVCWSILLVTYHNNQKQLLHQQLLSNRLLYTSNLAEKLNLIASSSAFTSYLRSGRETRKYLYIAMISEMLSLRDRSVIGMKIVTHTSHYLQGILSQKQGTIFHYGNVEGSYFMTLKLCYLNSSLNAQYGLCNNKWVIYFSKPQLIQKLKEINPQIQVCTSHENCNKLNLIATTEKGFFGHFPVVSNSPMMVPLKIKSNGNELLFWVLCISILLFFALIALIRFNTRRIVNKAFAGPIDEIVKALEAGEISKVGNYIEELEYLVEEFQKYYEQRDKVEVAKVAEQAAHDIRSPLVALETLLKHLSGIPESQRLIIINAVNQIHGIANNLLHHKTALESNLHPLHHTMLAPVLQYLLSEKHNELDTSPIRGNIQIAPEIDTCFVMANSTDLKRVLSNLFNNAVQALDNKEGDRIDIKAYYTENNRVCVELIDNGRGIPAEKLEEIFQEGVSYQKKQGTGLGLYHAKKMITQWGGELTLSSEVGKGTTIHICLPRQPTPTWFAQRLSITSTSLIVVVDDSRSIYNIWQQRIMELNPSIHLQYFDSPTVFSKWYQKAKADMAADTVFLIDFEFPNEMTGLELIAGMNDSHQKYLVTSRGEEFSTVPEYVAAFEQYDFLVIPKFYCDHIPLHVLTQPDMVLMEPESLLCKAWALRAKQLHKNLITYTQPYDGLNDIRLYHRNTPVYIAIELIDVAEKLKRLGFMQVTVVNYDATQTTVGDFPAVAKDYRFQ